MCRGKKEELSRAREFCKVRGSEVKMKMKYARDPLSP
jgi:hypothetical protein